MSRARHLASVPAVAPPPPLLVQLTTDQLTTVVRDAVRAELARREHDDTDWIDAAAVAKILQVHPRTVSKLIDREGLPSHRVTAKLLRYRRSEVLSWLEQRSTRDGRSRNEG